jgi:pyruvate formate lyase activating enzyme
MKIRGLQKFTLLDYPEKLACTIFLFGCNFRCGFCHNPELVTQDSNPEISKEEILNFLKKRQNQLEAVCITGGEPLLTLEKDFLIEIKDLGYLIKLDTNGSFPEKLEELLEENLIDYVAMDLKNSKEKYSLTSGANVNLENIEKSIKLIVNSGVEYEFRTTIIPELHNEKDLENLGNWIFSLLEKKPKKYYLQGFKNFGKFIDMNYKNVDDCQKEHLQNLKKISEKYFKKVEIRI